MTVALAGSIVLGLAGLFCLFAAAGNYCYPQSRTTVEKFPTDFQPPRRWFLIMTCAGFGAVFMVGGFCLFTQVFLPASRVDEVEQVVHTTFKQKVLTDSGTKTVSAAVSPDGKQVAIARLELYNHKPAAVYIVFVDRKGEEKKRSSRFPVSPTPLRKPSIKIFGGFGREAALGQTWLWWDRASAKIIVYGLNVGTAIYDPATDRLRRLGRVTPIVCGGTAVPLHGKGLLTTQGQGETLEMSLTQWDGTRRRIVIEPSLRDMVRDAASGGKPDTLLAMPGMPRCRDALFPNKLFPSWWEGGTAVVKWPSGAIRIDTTQLVATFTPASLPATRIDGKLLLREHAFADTSKRLRLLVEEHVNEQNERVPEILLEVLDPRSGHRRTIVPKISPAFEGNVNVDVAPNGRLVAVRAENRIWVVDSRGDLVADFNVEKAR